MEDDNSSSRLQNPVFNLAMGVMPDPSSNFFDDDGRINRSGTVWTASAHIITAVIGSGVLSLAWAMAQLGWVAGPTVMLLFSFVTYYTSSLLADCYRTGDPVTGRRNHTYMDAAGTTLGRMGAIICGMNQYVILWAVAIGYLITASISMMEIKRSNCFHETRGESPCLMSATPYMITFAAIQIVLSQIPDFDQVSWISTVAAVMSFTYSIIAFGLAIDKVAENGKFGGSLTGIISGDSIQTNKIWRSFQALGDMAFAYTFSMIFFEIQDTIRSAESKTMKRATLLSVSVTTILCMLCGCMGYAAFGDDSPGNLLIGFRFHNPYWLLDIANAAIVVHQVGAYQLHSQLLFAFIEKSAASRFPDSDFFTKEIKIPIPGYKHYNLNLFRLIWRTIFVISTTIISMLLPFFNDVVGLLGALGFWPLTVYFPIEMYISQHQVPKWNKKWVCLQILSIACLVITIAAATGSVAAVVDDLKTYKLFGSIY